MAAAKNSSSGFSWATGLACVAIALAALAVYYNSLSSPFIFDDWPAITENLTIRHFRSALSPPHNGSGVDGRPMVNLSLALNYAAGGLHVWGYHATNLVIHVLAGLMLFGIVRRTLLCPQFAGLSTSGVSAPDPQASEQGSSFADSATVLAFAVALLWTVHPLQTESVTCVIQRTESLMGLFYLATLYCFIRGIEGRSQRSEARRQGPEDRSDKPEAGGRKLEGEVQRQAGIWHLESGCWLLAAVCTCALGMVTKEVMVSAPLIVLLYDRTFAAGTFREAWRRRGGWHLGLFATWLLLGYLVVDMGGSRGEAAGFGLAITPWAYALTQCRAVVLYLGLAVWPHPLVFDYGSEVVQHVAAVAPQAILLTLLVALTIFMLRYRPVLGFAGACFFLILAPSSSVLPLVGQTVAEHRMYLPLAAVMALLVLGLYATIGRRSLILCAVAAVGLGWLTVQRNKDYRSDLAIWSDTVAKCPGSVRARNNLGGALASIPGRLPDAIAAYETALRMKPDFADAHNNLACALASIPGRLPEAIGHFETAIRLNPDHVKAHDNFGIVLYKTGRIPEATVQFEEAVRIDPDYAEAHNNLGLVLDHAGRNPAAISEFEKAVRIDPAYAEAHYNLGTSFARRGQLSEAIVQLEAAVRINPDYAAAHKNLGIAFYQAGQIPEAMAQCQEVLRITPDSAEARAFLEKLQKAAR